MYSVQSSYSGDLGYSRIWGFVINVTARAADNSNT